MMLNLNKLYSEIHFLAFHYHWSEKDILDLPLQKRRMYVNMLLSELESKGQGRSL